MWLTDLLTDKRTDRRADKRVAGGHYCWGVLLWPPQLGLGVKCDKKWKLKNVEKITSFSDAVTLTFDLRPWKVNQAGHYHYQCVYQIWEQSILWFLGYRVNTIAGGGRLRRKTITSPDPSDTGDIIIKSPGIPGVTLCFVPVHTRRCRRRRRRPQTLVPAITSEQLFGFLSFLVGLMTYTCRLDYLIRFWSIFVLSLTLNWIFKVKYGICYNAATNGLMVTKRKANIVL